MKLIQADDYDWKDLGIEKVGEIWPDGGFRNWSFNELNDMPIFMRNHPFIFIDQEKRGVYIKGLHSKKLTLARMLSLEKRKVVTIDDNGKIKCW